MTKKIMILSFIISLAFLLLSFCIIPFIAKSEIVNLISIAEDIQNEYITTGEEIIPLNDVKSVVFDVIGKYTYINVYESKTIKDIKIEYSIQTFDNANLEYTHYVEDDVLFIVQDTINEDTNFMYDLFYSNNYVDLYIPEDIEIEFSGNMYSNDNVSNENMTEGNQSFDSSELFCGGYMPVETTDITDVIIEYSPRTNIIIHPFDKNYKGSDDIIVEFGSYSDENRLEFTHKIEDGILYIYTNPLINVDYDTENLFQLNIYIPDDINLITENDYYSDISTPNEAVSSSVSTPNETVSSSVSTPNETVSSEVSAPIDTVSSSVSSEIQN